MRKTLAYVLVIAGGVFVASCMKPISLADWRVDEGLTPSDSLPASEINWEVTYKGTDAEGNRLPLNPDDPSGKQSVTYGPSDVGRPAFYRVGSRVFFEQDGKVYGFEDNDLTRIIVDKPYLGEGLSRDETLVVGVYEPLESDEMRLASSEVDPSVLIALMLANLKDYYCIKCGGERICAVNPQCP